MYVTFSTARSVELMHFCVCSDHQADSGAFAVDGRVMLLLVPVYDVLREDKKCVAPCITLDDKRIQGVCLRLQSLP